MPSIKYVGTSDFRVLSAEDAKRAGVEGFVKTTWARNEAKEVSAGVATWLTRSLGDEFVEEVQPKTAADSSRAGASANKNS